MKHIAATFVFFTRLPFWRLSAFRVPPDYFRQVVNYWAVAGWLTGGVMAGTLWLAAQVFPYTIAVVLAILSRLLLTGALHEDGLADFLDGFGGGRDRERILAIMKDSHIGAYGVIGLIIYFLMLHGLLGGLPLAAACAAILAGDPLSKFVSSQITRFLPYARTAETSKAKMVYDTPSAKAFLISLPFAVLPLAMIPDVNWLAAILFPVILFCALTRLMMKKIGGYTGDCCGALFLLCELSFYAGIVLIFGLR